MTHNTSGSAVLADEVEMVHGLSLVERYRNLVTGVEIAKAASKIANELSLILNPNDIFVHRDPVPHESICELATGVNSVTSVDTPFGVAALAFLSEEMSDAQTWTAREKLAGCLWSALAFQAEIGNSEQQAFRRKIISLAECRFLTMSDAVRARAELSSPYMDALRSEESEQGLCRIVKELCDAIKALRVNATLDNEERDLLHLLVAGHSGLVKQPFSSLADPLRTITLGIETAFRLIHPPCDRHAVLVTGQVRDGAEMNLASVISFVGDLGKVLTRRFDAEMLHNYPEVFPLLSALACGKSKVCGASTLRTAAEWGCRALLEAAIYNLLLGQYEEV